MIISYKKYFLLGLIIVLTLLIIMHTLLWQETSTKKQGNIVANLMAIDWGTSSFRAYSIDNWGKVLHKVTAEDGILSVENGAYEQVLEMHLSKFSNISPSTPIIAAGMITSRQGWCETPYIKCPAGVKDLASHLIPFESANFGTIWFVPGVRQSLPDPDIIRGEEIQLAGLQKSKEFVAIMPGTHSKWVEVKDQTIVRFKTFMTGELHSIIMKYSILGSDLDTIWDDKAFKRGVHQGFSLGRDGKSLLSGLFQVRVQTILGQEPEANSSSHVSGLLIGCEIAEAVRDGFNKVPTKLIVGTTHLSGIYNLALSECGIDTEIAMKDISARGLYRIAKQKKLV